MSSFFAQGQLRAIAYANPGMGGTDKAGTGTDTMAGTLGVGGAAPDNYAVTPR
jgi:hypothetical protein